MCNCVSAENRKVVIDHEAKYYLLHPSHCYVCLMTGLWLSAECNCFKSAQKQVFIQRISDSSCFELFLFIGP